MKSLYIISVLVAFSVFVLLQILTSQPQCLGCDLSNGIKLNDQRNVCLIKVTFAVTQASLAVNTITVLTHGLDNIALKEDSYIYMDALLFDITKQKKVQSNTVLILNQIIIIKMKSYLALFAFTILLSVAKCDDQSAFFDKIAQVEFGQTIIETIQLELNQEDSLSRILEMLKQMQADTQTEQQEADATIKNRQSGCTQSIAQIDTTVQRASQKRAEDQQSLPLKEEELQDKQRQAEEKQEEGQRNNDRIHILVAERKESKGLYDERRDELTGLIVALKEAKQIITQLLQSDSFLQLNDDIFNEIKSHHKTFLKYYPNKRGFNSLVSLLLETAADPAIRADQQLVQQVLSVLDDLIDSLYDVQKSEMQAEDARGLAFQKSIARLELSNRNLQQTIASLEAQVQTLSQSLLELNNDIATQDQIVDAKKTERQDWNKTCNDEQNAYNNQTDNRSEESEILLRCIDIFENGLSKEAKQKLQNIKV